VWSFGIIIYEPVHKSHVEVFVGAKGIFEEEIVIDNLPESLNLSICLWSSYLGVFVGNIQFLKHYLKTMKVSGFLMMCGKFESII